MSRRAPTPGIRGRLLSQCPAAAVLLAALFPASLIGGEAEDDFWGPATPRLPFDEKPFRPIRIPAWLEDITRYAYMQPEDYSAAAVAGAQMTEIAFGGTRYVHYRSRLLPCEPGLLAALRAVRAHQPALRRPRAGVLAR